MRRGMGIDPYRSDITLVARRQCQADAQVISTFMNSMLFSTCEFPHVAINICITKNLYILYLPFYQGRTPGRTGSWGPRLDGCMIVHN